MNWLDIAFLTIFLGAVLYGVFSGLVMQLCNALIIVLGIFTAGRLGTRVGDFLHRFLNDEAFCQIAAFAAIFLAVAIGLRVAALLLRAVIKKFRFGTADRVLGAIVAGVAAALLCIAVCMAGVHARKGFIGRSMQGSSLSPHLVHVAKTVRIWASEKESGRLKDFLDMDLDLDLDLGAHRPSRSKLTESA